MQTPCHAESDLQALGLMDYFNGSARVWRVLDAIGPANPAAASNCWRGMQGRLVPHRENAGCCALSEVPPRFGCVPSMHRGRQGVQYFHRALVFADRAATGTSGPACRSVDGDAHPMRVAPRIRCIRRSRRPGPVSRCAAVAARAGRWVRCRRYCRRQGKRAVRAVAPVPAGRPWRCRG